MKYPKANHLLAKLGDVKPFHSRFAFLIVVLTGLFGSIYVLSNITQPNSTVKNESIIFDSELYHLDAEILEIIGNQRVGEQLDFHINNFNPKTNYIIEFDNNECAVVNKLPFIYTFHTSGFHNVKLMVENETDVYILEKQAIYIDEPIYKDITP